MTQWLEDILAAVDAVAETGARLHATVDERLSAEGPESTLAHTTQRRESTAEGLRRLRQQVAELSSLLGGIHAADDAWNTNFTPPHEGCGRAADDLLRRARQCVMARLTDSDYGRRDMARDMCMSESSLYKKLRSASGRSISGYINKVRMEEAVRLARQHPDWQMKELAYRVGFGTAKYMTACFKQEYGMLLRDYVADLAKRGLA